MRLKIDTRISLYFYRAILLMTISFKEEIDSLTILTAMDRVPNPQYLAMVCRFV
ncbi:MAG: hypothetical protein OEY51_14205 [Cyclobacteriaceae bacterium]|nr:hypothetical protein [Cyclobacteriaceae bacterium]